MENNKRKNKTTRHLSSSCLVFPFFLARPLFFHSFRPLPGSVNKKLTFGFLLFFNKLNDVVFGASRQRIFHVLASCSLGVLFPTREFISIFFSVSSPR